MNTHDFGTFKLDTSNPVGTDYGVKVGISHIDTVGFQLTDSRLNEQIMRISWDGVWVNPNVPVDEAARKVLDAIGLNIAQMLETKTRDLVAERDALQARVAELEKDAARYQFIRSGEVYIEPNHYNEDGKCIKEFYAAFETGKYYHDMRDFDTDIDLAMKEAK